MAHIKTKSGDTISNHHNFYALMDFSSEKELSISNYNFSYLNTRNTYFTNGTKALTAFLHTTNPYSQLAVGDTMDDLKEQMEHINKNINSIIASQL